MKQNRIPVLGDRGCCNKKSTKKTLDIHLLCVVSVFDVL